MARQTDKNLDFSVYVKKTQKLYGLEEQKITQGLKQQPHIELLDQVETIEQFACWVYQLLFYNCVSESWQAIHGAVTNPMRDKLEAGLINKSFYNQAWLTAIFFQRAWELLQISYHDCIQPELERLGLGSRNITPFEYFGWIVCHDSRTGFNNCLKTFYNFQPRKHSRACRRAVEALAEGKPLPGTKDDLNPAICLMLSVCQKKATNRNPAIKSSFEAFKVAAIDLYDFLAKYYAHAPSHRWVNGHYERGTQASTYKPLTKVHNLTKIQIDSRILL